jgi:hypothetical protein
LAWSGKKPLGAVIPSLFVEGADSASRLAPAGNAAAPDAASLPPTPSAYDKRAIPLTALLPLLALPNIEWHIMQTDISEEDAECLREWMPTYSIVLRSNDFRHFGDTADAMTELDHVISVDTSVVHLAGAMGWPVSLLLPLAADWRWTDIQAAKTPSMQRPHTGEPSLWYPSVTMFRQTNRNDWAPVVAAVATSLIAGFALKL